MKPNAAVGALWVVVASAIAIALALRHGLVEPALVAQRCDAAPWQGVDCVVRSLTVQVFIHQRLGMAAFGLAILALWRRSLFGSVAAAGMAAAGLVLYGAGWAAPAAVLALLAWVVARRWSTDATSPAATSSTTS
jgi:hypothetical protein